MDAPQTIFTFPNALYLITTSNCVINNEVNMSVLFQIPAKYVKLQQ